MVALNVKQISLVLALSGRVSLCSSSLTLEIDWPTFQSTDEGSVPAGRELSPLQCIKDSSLPSPLHLILEKSVSWVTGPC